MNLEIWYAIVSIVILTLVAFRLPVGKVNSASDEIWFKVIDLDGGYLVGFIESVFFGRKRVWLNNGMYFYLPKKVHKFVWGKFAQYCSTDAEETVGVKFRYYPTLIGNVVISNSLKVDIVVGHPRTSK